MTRAMASHAPSCTRPGASIRVNSIGVAWATCRGCGARWRDAQVSEHPTPEPEPDDAPTTPVAPVARQAAAQPAVILTPYRCREHPDQPVTPRGTGCPQCRHTRNKPKVRTTEKETQR